MSTSATLAHDAQTALESARTTLLRRRAVAPSEGIWSAGALATTALADVERMLGLLAQVPDMSSEALVGAVPESRLFALSCALHATAAAVGEPVDDEARAQVAQVFDRFGAVRVAACRAARGTPDRDTDRPRRSA
jgi:hypothetical protein